MDAVQKTADFILTVHGWDLSGYSRISGFRYLSESNKTGFEMHFEYEFRIQTLTWSHPCDYNNEGTDNDDDDDGDICRHL